LLGFSRPLEAECPCQPVKFANGDIRYNVQDLDAWLNTLKVGGSDQDADAIVGRLG
jgi:hypothetical protein